MDPLTFGVEEAAVEMEVEPVKLGTAAATLAASVVNMVLVVLLLAVLLAVETGTVVVHRVFFSPGDLKTDLLGKSGGMVTVTSSEQVDTSITVSVTVLAVASWTVVIRARISLRDGIFGLGI